MTWEIITESNIPDNYDEISEHKCPDCGGNLTVGEWDCIGQCSICYEKLLSEMPNDF